MLFVYVFGYVNHVKVRTFGREIFILQIFLGL
jgi:hypothetical protein